MLIPLFGNELKAAETPNLSKTDHQVCLAHARAKFVKASEQAGDKNADIFIKYIEDLYNLERQYTKDNLTDEERGKQRQSLETKGILIKSPHSSWYREVQGSCDCYSLFAESVELSGYILDKPLYLYKGWKLSDRQQCSRACSPSSDNPTK